MSVLQLQETDALSDDRLVITYDPEQSEIRSAQAERQVFAYAVDSDSGNTYETEILISDLQTVCGYCSCLARVVCRHLKAVLHDVRQREPTFGTSLGWSAPATLREAAEAALQMLTGSDREYALVDVDRPHYTICDMLREALGHPPQDRSDWT